MTYDNPDVEVLGHASALIGNNVSKGGTYSENGGAGYLASPAYDLDE